MLWFVVGLYVGKCQDEGHIMDSGFMQRLLLLLFNWFREQSNMDNKQYIMQP